MPFTSQRYSLLWALYTLQKRHKRISAFVLYQRSMLAENSPESDTCAQANFRQGTFVPIGPSSSEHIRLVHCTCLLDIYCWMPILRYPQPVLAAIFGGKVRWSTPRLAMPQVRNEKLHWMGGRGADLPIRPKKCYGAKSSLHTGLSCTRLNWSEEYRRI